MLPKIIDVEPKPNYVLEVLFENNEKRAFSVTPYFKYTVYKPLENIPFFNNVVVKYGTLVWGNDELIDFDPYTIYQEGKILE
jgi:Protein of unknown function (DUF2442)